MRSDSARILLVEDEPEILALVRRYLEGEGHRVVAAMDGESALRLEEGADLVILDLMLPVLGGLDVIRGLRSAGRDVPVLILSAREDEEDRVTALDLGADDYLTKPFRPKELLARVRALLRRTRTTPLRESSSPVSIDADLRRRTAACSRLPARRGRGRAFDSGWSRFKFCGLSLTGSCAIWQHC